MGDYARIDDVESERRDRSRALSRNPRPLSARQAAILREAVAPLLRDMAATGQTPPEIRAEAHADRGPELSRRPQLTTPRYPAGHVSHAANSTRRR